MNFRTILFSVLLASTCCSTLAAPSSGHIYSPQDFIPHVSARAIAYQHAQYAIGFGVSIWHLVGLWILLRTGLASSFRSMICTRFHFPIPNTNEYPPRLLTVSCFLALVIWMLLWSLPPKLAGLALEGHYGFSRQSVFGLLGDMATESTISLIGIPILFGIYRLITQSPKKWWIWLWAIGIPILFIQIVLSPILISPLFNRFTSMPPGHLRDSILELAGKSGISDARVFVVDTSRRTSHVNAYVAGLGPTTRIVLNDTALKLLPEDQILAMLGHEMGHYVEGHIWAQFIGGSLGLGVFLYLAFRLLPATIERRRTIWNCLGILDPAALPALMLFLSLFILVQAPVENAESRYLERRADIFGLNITHLNEPMARLFVSFVERDFADPDPPRFIQFWFGSHPPLRERIASALNHSD